MTIPRPANAGRSGFAPGRVLFLCSEMDESEYRAPAYGLFLARRFCHIALSRFAAIDSESSTSPIAPDQPNG